MGNKYLDPVFCIPPMAKDFFTVAAPLTPAVKPQQTSRVFYVIQHQEGFFSKDSGGTFGFHSTAVNTVNDVTQYATAADAFARLARHTGCLSVREYRVVRVERTVTPGKTIPGKTERRVLQEGDYKAGSQFAVAYGNKPWFLASKDLTGWAQDINAADLSRSEEGALYTLQQAALKQNVAYSAARIVRVIETTTPATTEPDTVVDSLLVL